MLKLPFCCSSQIGKASILELFLSCFLQRFPGFLFIKLAVSHLDLFLDCQSISIELFLDIYSIFPNVSNLGVFRAPGLPILELLFSLGSILRLVHLFVSCSSVHFLTVNTTVLLLLSCYLDPLKHPSLPP